MTSSSFWFISCIVIFSFLLPFVATGQLTINGQILEQSTQQPIADVVIYDSIHFSTAISDLEGNFSISIEKLPIKLFFQHIAYQEQSIFIENTDELQLLLTARQLDEVIVSGVSSFQDSRSGQISINKSVVNLLPSLGGEVDYISSLVLFPGVSNGEEISKGITVRGGSLDQNLTHINGIQTSNTGHLFNLYSVVPAVAVEDLTFYKGGMPANFGNALSSSMNVVLKRPTKKVIDIEIGATNSKASFENTFGQQKKSSFLISGRSSYIDFLRVKAHDATLNNFNQRGPDADGPEYHFGYSFFDFLGVLHLDLSKGYALDIFGLYSYDKNTYIYNRSYITYLKHELHNSTYGFTLSKKWNSKNSIELRGGLNDNKIKRQEKNLDFDENTTLIRDEFLQHEYGVKNWTSKLDFHHISDYFELHTGLFSYYKQYQPGNGKLETFTFDPVLRIRDTTLLDNQNEVFSVLLSGAYLQSDILFSDKLTANMGLRASIFFTSPKSLKALEPRVALSYKLGKTSHLRASFDYLTQFDHGLILSEVGLDNLISLPSIEDIQAGKSLNYALGFVSKQLEHKLILSGELFYKNQWNLQRLALDQKDNIVNNSLSELIAKNGTGYAYGFEAQLTYQADLFIINSSYTFSRSFRYFENFNNNESYPFGFDKPHELSISGVTGFNKKISFSFNFNLSNGARYTLPTGLNPSFVVGGRPVLIYNGFQNATHLPLYHRLDIGLDYNFNLNKKWKSVLKLNIINVYNRRNINFIELRENGSGGFYIEGVSYIPILPSINFKISY